MSKEIEILAWVSPETTKKYFNGGDYLQFNSVPEVQSNLYLKKLVITEAFLHNFPPDIKVKLTPWLEKSASLRIRVATVADNLTRYFFIAKSAVNGENREEVSVEMSFNDYVYLNTMFKDLSLYATRWQRKRYFRKEGTINSVFHIYLNCNSAYGWTMEYELNNLAADLDDEAVVNILLQTIRNEIAKQGQIELTGEMLDEMYNLVCLDKGKYFERFPNVDFNTDGTYEKLFEKYV